MRKRGSGSRTFCGIEAMEQRMMLAADGTFTSLSPLVATDPKTAHSATFSMVGPGTGTLTVGPNGIWQLSLASTSRTTAVTIRATEAVQLEQITAAQALGSLNAPMADWVASTTTSNASTMDFQGGVLSVVLHDSSAMDGRAHRMDIGLPDRPGDTTAITMHDMQDVDIAALMSLRALTANSYIAHGNYHPTIQTTGYFGAIAITHDVVGVSTSGTAAVVAFSAAMPNPATRKGIASIAIGGNITRSSIYTDVGSIGPVTVGGSMTDADIYTRDGALAKATVGGSMMNGSELRADNGKIGSVVVRGDVNDSKIYGNAASSLGSVTVMGSVTNGSVIAGGTGGTIGNIGPVIITGGLSDSTIRAYEGSISSVTIGTSMTGGSMTDGAQILVGDGTIGKVSIVGDLSGDSEVRVTGLGRIGSVLVGHNLDSSRVSTGFGNITQIKVGGNVDHGATIQAANGTLGALAVTGNIDNDSGVTSTNSLNGIGRVTIGGNAANGASIKADNTKIGSIFIGGSALGTGAGVHNAVEFSSDGGIATLSIVGSTDYTYITSSYGPIATVKIGGVMRRSRIEGSNAIRIGSVTVAQLDESRIASGLDAATPTGLRSDFGAAGTIGTITIKGVGTGPGAQFMINNSVIGAWFMGKVTFAAPSSGSGIIQSHTGTVVNAPLDALLHSIWIPVA